jgi:type II secretory pathway component PulF
VSAFTYEVVDPDGKRQRGRAEAATSAALTRSLESRGLLVITVEERGDDVGTSMFRPGRKREVLEVTRALAALLPAGMSLVPALGAACNVAGKELTEVLHAVRARVERGESLALALAAHPALFSSLYVGLVRAGERSGRLDETFQRLATQLERDDALRSKLLSAMIYPLLLAGVGSIAVIVLLLFVLPRFAELLQGSGATLPRSTAIVLAVAGAARHYWFALLLIPLAIGGCVYWMRTSDEGRRTAGRLLLSIPGVRTLRQYAIAARFSRVVSVLLAGGAPLLAALDEATASIADPIAKDDTIRIRRRVREGTSLRQSVAESPYLPTLLAQLVGVGEESGRLQDFLSKAADIFEERTERAAQRLATLAEPAMIVVFGVIVAFVALSLLQAIYGINVSSFK